MSVIILQPSGKITTKSTLAAAAVASDVAGKTVIVSSPITLSSDLTWPIDRALNIVKGGVITVSTGVTLTINGPLENNGTIIGSGNLIIAGAYSGSGTLANTGNVTISGSFDGPSTIATSGTISVTGPFNPAFHQVFTGSPTVTFGAGSIEASCPEWWGVDGTADDVQITKTLDSYSRVKLTGAYVVVAAIESTGSGNLYIDFSGSTIAGPDLTSGGAFGVFKLTGYNVTLKNPSITFAAKGSTRLNNAGMIELVDCDKIDIQGGKLSNSPSAFVYVHNTSTSSLSGSHLLIDGMELSSGLADGILVCHRATNVEITNCTIHDTGDDGIGVWTQYAQTDKTIGVNIHNNIVYSSAQRGIGVGGVKTCNITGNTIYSTTYDGIILLTEDSGTTGNVKHGEVATVDNNNICYCPTGVGVSYNWLDVVVSNNKIATATSVGISNQGTATIVRNRIKNAGVGIVGIKYDETSGANYQSIVKENTITDCAGGAMSIGSSPVYQYVIGNLVVDCGGVTSHNAASILGSNQSCVIVHANNTYDNPYDTAGTVMAYVDGVTVYTLNNTYTSNIVNHYTLANGGGKAPISTVY